ncbi:aconitate hydratase [Patescibacteria group bacterium AH-259-L07]|nr:aconitate hydratase [Patescibacteria group bacterium AH-259-L07]
MRKNFARKIIEKHLVEVLSGGDIALKVDQVLMQDATGTQACMQFERFLEPIEGHPSLKPGSWQNEELVIDEALEDGMTPLLQFEKFGLDKVQVPLAVQYVDHNIKQIDERNADDHAFLLSFAMRYGIWYSPMGNGICHQVHVERFAKPGAIVVGSDSHTTTSGAMGAIALGAGGLSVAVLLAGHPLWLRTPKVVQIHLTGHLRPWVSAKDIILELLRRFSVNWGTEVAGIGGTLILEFDGSGVGALSVPQRATIANMAAELNATALFPSDERTYEFLRLQKREKQYRPMRADKGAQYDMTVDVNLETLEPLIACPSNPDNVVSVEEVEGTLVAQVCVGSSVNSWYEDLAIIAKVLEGRRVPLVDTPDGKRLLQLLISPGSHQILNVMERKGFLKDLREAGGVILESACGPCVGMGGAPPSGTNSLRTMNRNFPGRSGTKEDRVYLASPETAAASAFHGVITDPRRLGKYPEVGTYEVRDDDFTDHLFVKPITSSQKRRAVTIVRGPHIISPPQKGVLRETLRGMVIAKFGDNISTGSISPDGVIVMGKRSHVGDIAKHTFEKEMPSRDEGASEFYRIAKEAQREGVAGFVFAGRNYGQGSSREAAAMVMVELDVHAVCAQSFARIHRTNLIEQGVLPLVISDELYDAVLWLEEAPKGKRQTPHVRSDQTVTLPKVREELASGSETITLVMGNQEFLVQHMFNERERAIVLAGGLINHLRNQTT